MAKKKKGGGGGRGGGGGGGGGGQQQEQEKQQDSTPAEERDDQENVEATSGQGQGKAAPAEEDTKGGKDHKGKEKDKKVPPLLPVVTAVLKVDMHCDGCAHRIRRSVRRFPGVEGVAMEVEKGTMTVVGRFDAKKLRDRVANKTKKKVDLVGNNNNKGGGGGGDKGGGGCGNQKRNEEGKLDKEDEHQKEGKRQDDKDGGGGNAGKGKGGKDNNKPAVPVVATVVLKIGSVGLHCDGCMHRIRTKLFKIKGVEQVRMEMAKNQVTVTGTMDVKVLPGKLLKKLGRPVDVVPPANNNKQQQQQQQQDGAKDQDKDKGGKEKALAAEVELWKCAFFDQQSLQSYELLLSDENPNACSIM